MSIIDFLKRLYGIDTPTVKTTQATAEVMVDYLLNDASTNTAIRLPMPPPTTDLRYTVQTTTPPTLSNCCYITLNRSIRTLTRTLGALGHPVSHWATIRSLPVYPLFGQDLNAFYDRKGIKLFYAPDPSTGKMIYLASSTDVVGHELGHALLDAVRPDFWDVQSLEIWAFHEAWADINAIMILLGFDEIVQFALDQTGGNLRKSNVISRMAEQLALVIYRYQGGTDAPATPCIRDAVNSFDYIDPVNLPEDGPDEELQSECHSFGRVWLGTWYDVFCGMYEQERQAGRSALDAVHAARDAAYSYMVEAVIHSAATPYYHDALARSMLALDRANGSVYQNTMLREFTKRNVLRKSYRAKANATTWGFMKEFVKGKGILTDRGHVKLATVREQKTVSVKDVLPRIGMSMLKVNGIDLTHLEMTVAADRYYEFDGDGRLTHEIVPDPEEIMLHAKKCLQFIRLKSDVGPDTQTLWEVRDNRLVRTLVI